MKKFLLILFLFGIVILNTSCENNAEMETITPGFVCTPNESYSNDISPILNQNCKPCHFSGAQFPDLSNYNSISQNANLIKTVTQNKTMPKEGSLTQDEIDAIACWVDNGALDN